MVHKIEMIEMFPIVFYFCSFYCFSFAASKLCLVCLHIASLSKEGSTHKSN